jgi:hypothetical protein
MTSIVCSTASAQTTSDALPHPETFYEFPVAKATTIAGVEYRCFEADGSWRTVAHVVVDYRAFYLWAQRADAEIASYAREATLLGDQVRYYKSAYDLARNGETFQRGLLDRTVRANEATAGRLKLERAALWAGIVLFGVAAAAEGVALAVQRSNP